MYLTRNQAYRKVPWVRIPPSPPDIVLTIVPDDLTTSLNAPPALRYGAFLHLGTGEVASWADELP